MSVYKLLKLRKISLFFGWGLVLALIVICLIPSPPTVTSFTFGDKFAHLLGYACLFLWFAQIYNRKAQLKLVLLLLILGVLVEVAQSFTAYRTFELADMLANAVGVLIGWLLAFTPLASVLVSFENHFLDK